MADDQDAAADMPVKTEWVGTYKSENDVFDEQRAFLNTLPQSEKDGRADGLFFSHMESIWGSNDATIQAEDFETIRRISEQGHAYDLCCKYIHDDSIEIGRESRSGKPTQTRMKRRSMLMAMTIVRPRTCYLMLRCAIKLLFLSVRLRWAGKLMLNLQPSRVGSGRELEFLGATRTP